MNESASMAIDPVALAPRRIKDVRTITVILLASFLLLIARLPGSYLSLFFTVSVLFCLALAVRRFDRVWILFVAALPFFALVSPLFGEPKITGVRVLLIGMVGLTLLTRRLRASDPLVPRRIGVMAFLLFVAANLVSGLNSGEMESVFRASTYLEPFLFCVLSYYVVRKNPDNLRRLLRALSIGGGVVAALGVFELVTQRPILTVLGITTSEDVLSYLALNRFGLGGRVVSVIGQPVYAGMYFAVWLIVTVGYMAFYRPRQRWLLALLLPFGLLVIASTGSRGPMLALVPTLLALVLFSRRRSRTLVVVVLLAGLTALLLYQLLPDLFAYFGASFAPDLYTAESANLSGRLQLTDVLLGIFRENPVLGYGPGLVQKAAQQGVWQFEGLAGLENQYAVILADGGLLAGAVYLLFMGAAFSSLFRVRRCPASEVSEAALIALLLFVFYFTVVVSATCLSPAPNLLVMTVYGAVLGRYDGWAAVHGRRRVTKGTLAPGSEAVP
jgi:O-antigen ligase